ncbi:MAG: hypothetical protein U5J83_15565 [Bryobacterales bacterium]|nr:hypothetical protein [Bryobacterales bacterium]
MVTKILGHDHHSRSERSSSPGGIRLAVPLSRCPLILCQIDAEFGERAAGRADLLAGKLRHRGTFRAATRLARCFLLRLLIQPEYRPRTADHRGHSPRRTAWPITIGLAVRRRRCHQKLRVGANGVLAA